MVRPCSAPGVKAPMALVDSEFTWVVVNVDNWAEVIQPAWVEVRTPISVDVRKSISVVDRLAICVGVKATSWVDVRF